MSVARTELGTEVGMGASHTMAQALPRPSARNPTLEVDLVLVAPTALALTLATPPSLVDDLASVVTILALAATRSYGYCVLAMPTGAEEVRNPFSQAMCTCCRLPCHLLFSHMTLACPPLASHMTPACPPLASHTKLACRFPGSHVWLRLADSCPGPRCFQASP